MTITALSTAQDSEDSTLTRELAATDALRLEALLAERVARARPRVRVLPDGYVKVVRRPWVS